ncbi:hypothetical protein RA180_09615 [Aeromonas salmonicida]|uniref:hypothetical protein n=1 Tax=Aeromonas salmonicida TaxID=645 RepID=UPI0027964753|nr:hypothetical protein [Aeromonas salmonicida]MDQ1884250.1 hypothetical protein [Aeromonas salmonicida]
MGFNQILKQTTDQADVVSRSDQYPQDLKEAQARISRFVTIDSVRLTNLAANCKERMEAALHQLEQAATLVATSPPDAVKATSILREVGSELKAFLPNLDLNGKELDEFKNFIAETSLLLKKNVVELQHASDQLNFQIQGIKAAMEAQEKKANGVGGVLGFFKNIFGLGSTVNLAEDEFYSNLQKQFDNETRKMSDISASLALVSQTTEQFTALDGSLRVLTSLLTAFISNIYALEDSFEAKSEVSESQSALIVGIYINVSSKQLNDALALL